MKIVSVLDKVSETMELISQLLRTKNAELFKYYGEYRMPLQVYNDNWKYNFYCLLKDENGIPIAIDNLQLDELMKWISTGVMTNRLQSVKIDFYDIKRKLRILIDEFSEMEHISCGTFYGGIYDKNKHTKFDITNKEFLECERIQCLNLMLQKMYKYLLYEEWIDSNLKLVWK